MQSEYARMAYEAHMAELTKLVEMYADLTQRLQAGRASRWQGWLTQSTSERLIRRKTCGKPQSFCQMLATALVDLVDRISVAALTLRITMFWFSATGAQETA